MSGCRNSVHRRLSIDELYNFYLPKVTQCQIVEILSAVGYPMLSCKTLSIGGYQYPMSSCRNSVCRSLPSVKLLKLCPLEVSKFQVLESLPIGCYPASHSWNLKIWKFSFYPLVDAHCHFVKICPPEVTLGQMMKLTEFTQCQVWKLRLQVNQ